LTSNPPLPFQTLLQWAQLAAANFRGDAFCIEEHRQALLQSGESEQRVDEIELWQLPNLFTETERAVIALSNAISEQADPTQLGATLQEAKLHLDPSEIQQLSSSVLAVNHWIDLHGTKPIRVLVVEDNQDDQELLNRQLQKTQIGDHVLFLSNPEVALQLLQGPNSVELRKTLLALIFDVHLPYMTGIELLRIIRSMESWELFPVVMMSTDQSPENIAACADLNVMAFIEKPLTVTSFASAVAPLFHRPVMEKPSGRGYSHSQSE
jgi:AhpD family alkylhydroperoxidase